MIALQHHERPDGAGYPKGLAGDEIHVFARITAIADVFDALGVKRVYKEAWPLDRILDYFREQRGKQFDDALTGVFLDNIEDFIAIRDEFPDVAPEE
jgi:HD-GYP domain-containing protein (c-di-GMP phosphodiesterase class II)